ncbi:MAG: hypothetical protein QS721_12760 [Candidatus Endonucleobacter sp. (ex Gigantidas childressi)]|nr:hypothetical protein [Candidatus Endonucleobacter sp. (ex Gigantidas childressi)]
MITVVSKANNIPTTLAYLELLAALTHPNHQLLVDSWGFAHLSPTTLSMVTGI